MKERSQRKQIENTVQRVYEICVGKPLENDLQYMF